MPRSEWGAYKPRKPNNKLETLPPNYVIVSHTASTVCLIKDMCIKHVRNIQDLHVKQLGWNDIGYNFLVGGDGNVYEGRGWDAEGAHTKGYNTKSIGIAFIGEFTGKIPTQAQVDAVKQLLKVGLSEKKLAANYKLLGQNQVKATQSPGTKVYEIIKTWDHWAESPWIGW